MVKVQDLDTYLRKMNKKLKIKDMNNQNYVVDDVQRFVKHIKDFHSSGSSIHEENGFFFVIDRRKMK